MKYMLLNVINDGNIRIQLAFLMQYAFIVRQAFHFQKQYAVLSNSFPDDVWKKKSSIYPLRTHSSDLVSHFENHFSLQYINEHQNL